MQFSEETPGTSHQSSQSILGYDSKNMGLQHKGQIIRLCLVLVEGWHQLVVIPEFTEQYLIISYKYGARGVSIVFFSKGSFFEVADDVVGHYVNLLVHCAQSLACWKICTVTQGKYVGVGFVLES